MKQKLVITAILLIYFSPTICYGDVRGELNKKFAKSFPRKLVVFATEAAIRQDTILSTFLKVIDKHSFELIENKEISGEMKKSYNPFSTEMLPLQVMERLKLKPEIQGVLLIDIRDAFPGFFDPYGVATKLAWLIVYDAQSGEWAYKFEAVCGWIMIPITCSITVEDMYRYFRSNLNHKIKHIKFRQ